MYRYTINIDNNNVFVTMPKFSDKSYRLDADSAKTIEEFLSNGYFTK